MPTDLLAFLENLTAPAKQEDCFRAARMESLFRSKIARSQATGKDGVRITRFAEIVAHEAKLIEQKVLSLGYRFTTYKERLVLRGAKREPRQISIPTVRDRLALRALCEVLHTHVTASVGSPPHLLVDRVVKAIRAGGEDERHFVRIDVRDFFPSVLHKRLGSELAHAGVENIAHSLAMAAVTTPTGDPSQPNKRGIPQGLSISTALSCIYMLRFDARQIQQRPVYVRYVDDILLIVPQKDAKETLRSVGSALNRLGLTIHKEGTAGKTEIKSITEGIDFLGYNISINKVSIRTSSYHRMFKNILKVLTDFRYRKNVERTLFRLNLKITGCVADGNRRGWMVFFSRTENMAQLAFLDKFVKEQLTRVGFPADAVSRVKTFVKSYHQIRYNLKETKYIPNLDEMTLEDKAYSISALSGRDVTEILAWDVNLLEQEFSRLISREIMDLERDVGSPS